MPERNVPPQPSRRPTVECLSTASVPSVSLRGVLMERLHRLDPAHDWVATRYYIRLLRPDQSRVAFAISRKSELDEILEVGASLGWTIEELAAPSR